MEVKIKTKKGEVSVPAVLEKDGTLNVQLESIAKEDLIEPLEIIF